MYTKSMTELKSIAASLGTVPTGDKRLKQSWLDAIESVHPLETVPEAAVVCEDVLVEEYVPDWAKEVIAHATDLHTLKSAIESEENPDVDEARSTMRSASVLVGIALCFAIAVLCGIPVVLGGTLRLITYICGLLRDNFQLLALLLENFGVV